MKPSALLLAFFTATAFAIPPQQSMLRKTYENGLVPPELRVQIVCEITTGQIHIQRHAGPLAHSTYENTVGTPWSATEKEIVRAQAGKITEEPAPTDGPTTTWEAMLGGRTTLLQAEGSRIAKNDALAARTLIHLLDLSCGPFGKY